MSLGLAFHVLAAVIWVGGMFFAHMMLRPGAGPLDTPTRLALWGRVLGRFFSWVWLSIVALLVSGVAMVMIGFGGFASLAHYINVMMAVGIVMMMMFAHVFFAPWKRFRRAVAAANWAEAERNIRQIRILVMVNLVLGLVTVVVGASGRYFG
ncbi:MAG TPA: CopD family protein [Steroidobacteraceae bacterium]